MLQDRSRRILVGQQPQQDQSLVEPAIGNHQAVFVHGIGFASFANSSQLQNIGEFLLGTNPQCQDGHDLEIFVTHRAQTNIVGVPVRIRPILSLRMATLGNGVDTVALPLSVRVRKSS